MSYILVSDAKRFAPYGLGSLGEDGGAPTLQEAANIGSAAIDRMVFLARSWRLTASDPALIGVGDQIVKSELSLRKGLAQAVATNNVAKVQLIQRDIQNFTDMAKGGLSDGLIQRFVQISTFGIVSPSATAAVQDFVTNPQDWKLPTIPDAPSIFGSWGTVGTIVAAVAGLAAIGYAVRSFR